MEYLDCHIVINAEEIILWDDAEGATAPETLRQKDRVYLFLKIRRVIHMDPP